MKITTNKSKPRICTMEMIMAIRRPMRALSSTSMGALLVCAFVTSMWPQTHAGTDMRSPKVKKLSAARMMTIVEFERIDSYW